MAQVRTPNETVIHTGIELEAAVHKSLFNWELPTLACSSARTDPGDDLLVEATIDGKAFRLAVTCKLRPTVRDIEELAGRPKEALPLLATVRLTDSLVAQCERLGVNCLDLNGRLWIRAKGMLIDRSGETKGTRYRLAEPPANLFSAKGSRLARMLLSVPDKTWTQNGLADLTGLSQGLLSRLLRHAADEGWVQGARRDWRVADPDGLLDAWVKADNWRKRGVLRQYSGLTSDLRALAEALLRATPGDLAFTQWFAASLRFPYTEPPVVSAYRERFPTDEELQSLGLREVSDGGRLWIIAPRDAGIFQAPRRVDGFPLVCDVQIYLDLLQVGLRGPDQAEALREWEGFRRP